jgi:phage shock protein B
MEDVVVPLIAITSIFVGLPWLVLHYMTRWRTAATLTREDENLLDELYDLARRLEDRMTTIERIIAADDPNWKKGA